MELSDWTDWAPWYITSYTETVTASIVKDVMGVDAWVMGLQATHANDEVFLRYGGRQFYQLTGANNFVFFDRPFSPILVDHTASPDARLLEIQTVVTTRVSVFWIRKPT